jgi:hypothetical protein
LPKKLKKRLKNKEYVEKWLVVFCGEMWEIVDNCGTGLFVAVCYYT